MDLVPFGKRPSRGATLLEMSLVIMMLLALTGSGIYFSGKIGEWRSGREAAETLRMVYAAQRMYLADNPTTPVSSLEPADLIPYLPAGRTEIPTVTSLEGNELPINVAVSPPVVDAGEGEPYDPSGSPNDGLWDVGR